MPQPASDLDRRAIDTIRFLAVDAVERANSGHPGMPMGAAPMAYALWQRHLRHNPGDHAWPDRDRFVLSAGHGSMLLYSLLHLTGYPAMTMDEIKNFRQWGSLTPGHPENFVTPGVETTTGPLGQGFATGIGFALAERMLAARFNRPGFDVVDHYTYGIVSDGDLMEGISHEAASLAGHLGLGRLIYLYDDNEISIDGSTEITFTENVAGRFQAYGWQVLRVEDGTDVAAVDKALEEARAESARPTLVVVRTVIGHGSPSKAGTSSAHGSPLGADEVTRTKQNLGWPEDATFHVPDDVAAHMDARKAGAERQREWEALVDRYRDAHPELGERFDAYLSGDLPEGWDAGVPTFDAGTSMATRAASGKVLNGLAKGLPLLVGGSADLAGSNKTWLDERGEVARHDFAGANIHFGVREHGMAAVANGITQHLGLRAYCGTFLIFSDYMRPAVRLAALMGTPTTFVFTHDSIGLGEDGPTHQPVEHYMALRAIPNLAFVRPADANETAAAWRLAMQRTDGPTALALTRQNLPTLDADAMGDGPMRGGYVLRDCEGTPDVILIGTGSEVSVALQAADRLASDGVAVRVVSLPCWSVFEAQSADYRASVLPASVSARVAVEAGVTMGWERYVGLRGRIVGLDRFGASAPYETLYEQLGLTADAVVAAARELL